MADTDTAAGVKSARRAVELLEAFGADHAWLSLTDLHHHTGLTGIERDALGDGAGERIGGVIRKCDAYAGFREKGHLLARAFQIARRGKQKRVAGEPPG